MLVALGIAAWEAQATVVVMHPLDTMSARSDVIVHARVSNQVVKRERDRIVTLTEIEVVDGIKGAKYGDVLTIYQVGGVFEGVTAKIAGMHEYALGEEMVLFAVNHRYPGFPDRIVSYGVGVGKFHVEVADQPGADRVVEDLTDVAVLSRDATGKPVMTKATPRAPESLAGFKAKIARFVADSRPTNVGPRVLKGGFVPKLLDKKNLKVKQ